MQATTLSSFAAVKSIRTNCGEDEQQLKGVVQLRVAGASEPLIVTCRSRHEADDVANLIDGYCRLANNDDKSYWMHKGQ